LPEPFAAWLKEQVEHARRVMEADARRGDESSLCVHSRARYQALEEVLSHLAALEGAEPPQPGTDFHDIEPGWKVARVYRDGSYLCDSPAGNRRRYSFPEPHPEDAPCINCHEPVAGCWTVNGNVGPFCAECYEFVDAEGHAPVEGAETPPPSSTERP
jgi:hypothetical protein